MSLSAESPGVFLGLASWHLYPDLTVFGSETKHVSQKDSLIPAAAVVTIGMQASPSREGHGLIWTVPLARLRYYGKPIIATGTLGVGSLRVPFAKCVQVAIGSLISDWGPEANNLDQLMHYFTVLNQCCRAEFKLLTSAKVTIPPFIGWVNLLAEQAESYLRGRDAERQDIKRHIDLGRREG